MIAYIGLWLRLILVTIVILSIIFFVQFDLILPNKIHLDDIIFNVPFLQYSASIQELFLCFVKMFLGSLLWWRIVKVFVFQGSPFMMGMAGIDCGKEHKTTGRPIDLIWIGSMGADITLEDPDRFGGQFWFFAAFRRHPKSDKLIRSRLLGLVLGGFGRSLVIEESRIFLPKENHKNRLRRFQDKYFRRYLAPNPKNTGQY